MFQTNGEGRLSLGSYPRRPVVFRPDVVSWPYQYLAANIRKEDVARTGSEKAERQDQSHLAPVPCPRLIAKVPHTRRWRVTHYGRRVMGTALYLRDQHFPHAYAAIAA